MRYLPILSLVSAQTGTINDIEHVVLYMQENRSFDHYYGIMKGVRGFGDRAAPKLRNGNTPFKQPTEKFNPVNALCGCGDCNLVWNGDGGELKPLLT
jgi:phospholipase C